MSGAEMLLIAGLKAFVPKETAEQFSAALQGMLNDGTLQGLGSLVSDIQEIKQNQRNIMLGMGRLAALLQERSDHGVPGGAFDGPRLVVLAEHGADGGPGGGGNASRQLDGGDVGSAEPFENVGGIK